MDLIERNYCVLSGRDDLEFLYRFERFPVFMGCVDHPPEQDLRTDMVWWISRSTGSIQLNPLIPLDVLYAQSHGSGSIGGLWQRHHLEFARFIQRHRPRHVLEIGGGHGILAQNYLQFVPDAFWTIVEPNPVVSPSAQIQVIKGFFDERFMVEHDRKIDAFVHSHVFEHIYAPLDFMALVSRLLGPGKLHLFSVPNLQVMLERNYTNCINFEHTVLLTEPFIEYILRQNGFMIQEKQYFLDDHSIFYSAVRDETLIPVAIPSEYQFNRRIYNNFINFYQELVRDLNGKMADYRGEVYLFGAHVFAQYLLGFGLDESRIRGVLDNDPKKQLRRLYGSNLMVNSPRILREAADPAVILRAGIYNQEVKEDILMNINPGVVFWE